MRTGRTKVNPIDQHTTDVRTGAHTPPNPTRSVHTSKKGPKLTKESLEKHNEATSQQTLPRELGTYLNNKDESPAVTPKNCKQVNPVNGSNDDYLYDVFSDCYGVFKEGDFKDSLRDYGLLEEKDFKDIRPDNNSLRDYVLLEKKDFTKINTETAVSTNTPPSCSTIPYGVFSEKDLKSYRHGKTVHCSPPGQRLFNEGEKVNPVLKNRKFPLINRRPRIAPA